MLKVLGTTEEVTTCDHCGKTNLKKTVVLDDGEKTVHFGRDCAARALGLPPGSDGRMKASSLSVIWKKAKGVQFAKDNIGKIDPMKIAGFINTHYSTCWVERGYINIVISKTHWEKIKIP